MRVDRGLVREHERFVGAVRDTHNVHVVELGAGLAPVAVGKDVVAAYFATGLDLATRRDGPVEERVIAGDALAARRFLDVLEERREAPEELTLVQRLCHSAELIKRNARLTRPRIPQLAGDLFRRELALQRGEHAPLELA